MNKRVDRLTKSCKCIFVAMFLISFCSNSESQDLSNGRIDFIFKPLNDITQFALWLEDGNGNYIGTVFLTNFIGRRGGGNRTSNPNIDIVDGNRLSALPIWAHKRGVIDNTFGLDSYYPPDETQSSYPDNIDAVSGATPGPDIQKKTLQISDRPNGTYKCWIEVNQAYNPNAYHNYSYYRGQPSVVWLATINVTQNPDSAIVLNYAGYGSPDGSTGSISPPDQTITTATDLLSDMGGYKFKVVFKPEGPLSVKKNPADLSQKHICVLKRIFPNPVNSSAVISYSIIKSGMVTLKIYNIRGEEIRTIVNSFYQAGDYTMDLNVNSLPGGFYILKLQLGKDYSDTRTIMVL